MKTLDKIKKLKELAVQEILNDPSKSRYEKLEQIESEQLWPTEPWIKHPFKDGPYGEKFPQELKDNPDSDGYVCSIIDDYMSSNMDYKGQTVYLHSYFEEDYPESYDTPEEYEEFLNSKVPILTSRGRHPRKMEITTREFMDYLWNWAITNKCAAWKFDW